MNYNYLIIKACRSRSVSRILYGRNSRPDRMTIPLGPTLPPGSSGPPVPPAPGEPERGPRSAVRGRDLFGLAGGHPTDFGQSHRSAAGADLQPKNREGDANAISSPSLPRKSPSPPSSPAVGRGGMRGGIRTFTLIDRPAAHEVLRATNGPALSLVEGSAAIRHEVSLRGAAEAIPRRFLASLGMTFQVRLLRCRALRNDQPGGNSRCNDTVLGAFVLVRQTELEYNRGGTRRE